MDLTVLSPSCREDLVGPFELELLTKVVSEPLQRLCRLQEEGEGPTHKKVALSGVDSAKESKEVWELFEPLRLSLLLCLQLLCTGVI